MLTGVTKFSQVSVFSGFNQPKDISMDPRYESLCGITQEEMERYFHEPISELAEKDECTYEEMKERLKAQYDGYHFSENMLDIYNPFSILNAFDSLQIRDYWFASGTPTYPSGCCSIATSRSMNWWGNIMTHPCLPITKLMWNALFP